MALVDRFTRNTTGDRPWSIVFPTASALLNTPQLGLILYLSLIEVRPYQRVHSHCL